MWWRATNLFGKSPHLLTVRNVNFQTELWNQWGGGGEKEQKQHKTTVVPGLNGATVETRWINTEKSWHWVSRPCPGWHRTKLTWAARGVRHRPNFALGSMVLHKWLTGLNEVLQLQNKLRVTMGWEHWLASLEWQKSHPSSLVAVTKFTLRKCPKAKSHSRTLWLPWFC